MRGIEKTVGYALCYEFEDVVAEVTGADRIDLDHADGINLSRRCYKLARMATGSRSLARKLAIRPPQLKLARDYELFFPVLNHPDELYALSAIPNWRERCQKAVCFICEAFSNTLHPYLLELLEDFDHIFVGSRTAVHDIARMTGRPCSYLPLACDVVKFAPPSPAPVRSIDVCNIGRRSWPTHRALLELSQDHKIFYYYDTVAASGTDRKQRTFRVENASEHRQLLASVLQRSKFYIANRSRANEGGASDRQEISGRFYEGAAAGAVLLGEPPDCVEFRQQFDWPDALINMPFDMPDIENVLTGLNGDPVRLRRISWNNVRNAALRHDWSYRIRDVFEATGIAITPGMLEREKRLNAIVVHADEQLALGRPDGFRPAIVRS